ncbi:putative membrane protein [Janibacter sp. HTCC2649]|uniref:type II secretion system F family protein n=1 Tax=Janibacter sp. HTCC2649 TaxID=313589 RepID=UPI0000670F89|nr:type II secretion system F family protein [Janibacter sp. HTCC2649]EAP97563.1 putative membrane protein [Janibacter sp. HTCC2649]
MSPRTLLRPLLSVVLTAMAVLCVPISATAADPIPGSIGGIKVTTDRVTGVLTLRPGEEIVSIDPGMIATLDGRPSPVTSKPATRAQRTTVLLIDTSGSMGRSGMATVRTAVKDFLASAPKDVRIGVVSFGNTAGPEIAPTTARAAVQAVVDDLRADGNTALFSGVTQAVRMLGSTGDRSIVLLSDGKNTVGDRASGLAAAGKALTASQVRVEVVRFTTGENDPEALAAFAKAGGGSVVQATDAEGVRTAFQTAAKVLESQVQFDITRPPGMTGSVPVVVQGTATGRPFSIKSTVDLGEVGTPAPSSSESVVVVPEAGVGPATLTRVETGMSKSLIAALIALFVGALTLVIAVLDPFRSKRHDRVAQVEHYTLGEASRLPRKAEANASVVAQSAVRMGERVMAGRETTSRTMALIQRADLPLRAGEWFVLRVVAIVVGGALTPVVLAMPWWFTVPIGIALGYFLPAAVLRMLAGRRAKKFEQMLPDILMLVATTLASGFSLTQALDAVARDSAQPAGKEFSRTLAETRIGADVSDALENMSVRMDSEAMRWTTMAIRIQRDVGGNLADTLRTTAHTLRERESLKRQVNSLSAEGRLSAYILLGLPILLFVYMAWSNPAYTSLLWTRTVGILMLLGSGVSMVIGTLWMRKVIQIEV